MMKYWNAVTRSMTLLAVSGLIWQTTTIAQATPRGESGFSYGSEVSGNPDDHDNAKPQVSAAAVRAQTAAKSVVSVVAQALQNFESGAQSYALASPTGSGGGSGAGSGAGSGTVIAVTAPTVASTQSISVDRQSEITLVMRDGTQTVPTQRKFAAVNPKTAARVSAMLAGTLQGLQQLQTSSPRVEQGIAIATNLGRIPQSSAIAPEQIAPQLVVLLAMMDQLPQDRAIQGADRVRLSDAINAYNALVQTASPEVIVTLAQQPEFQSVESELRGLRAMAGK
jgi:hypothetical protein